jgi:alkanesulfonate monooxygenase SsuD/methylene tetrahydromethanopterin reductase-like flavin-dependent oxidoreductase (luciferase family)
MEHGVASSLRLQDAGPLAEAIERSAAAVEDAGFASWWTLGEREVVVDSSLDPTLGLQCAARATSRLRLGYSGELPSVQPAAVRAKQIASVDWFSGGRVELGLDLAAPPEVLVDPLVGVEDHLGLSLERYAAMCALWTQRRARHAGERFSFRGASALPRPLGDRVPTTHVRSTSAAVLERFVAGAGVPDGWLAWRETPEQLVAGVAVLEAVLGAAAADVRRTWFVDVDSVAEARAAVTGLDVRVDELVVVLDRLPTADDLRALAPSAAA